MEALGRLLPFGSRRRADDEGGELQAGVPATLSERHVADLRVLSDRRKLLARLPEGGTVAELGVDEGEFSAQIRAIARPESLYLIDTWATDRYHEGKMRLVEERFSREIESGEVHVLRERSEEALARFPDGHFDWVYIDTTHQYEQTVEELEISRRKVRAGGVIAGDDYCVGNPPKSLSYGVIPAVHRFCVEHDWGIVYLTLETDGRRSFALRQL